MMDCKKALTEANGEMEKATEILREKGLAAAQKKAGRIASEGVVHAAVDGKTGVVVEVNSETDFVGKNADFIAFVEAVAKTVADGSPADVAALHEIKLAGTHITVEEALREKILVIGENLKIRRFERYEGVLASYVHGGGRIGVMVQFETDDKTAGADEFKAAAKDVAMQIAAAQPLYVGKADVPADVLEKEKEILTAQAMNEGKPKEIAEKMVMGRIGKYYKDFCLVEQPFVKNQDQSVQQYLDEVAKGLGAKIAVKRFVRFEKGEGLEKREDNFADEVAGMMKQE
jgi:elongation factor Ts